MHIFEEISWSQFQTLDYIRNLSLNEQVNYYNQYLYELSVARHNWITYQNKGEIPLTLQIIGELLQENLFDLLQEDGSQILITGYA